MGRTRHTVSNRNKSTLTRRSALLLLLATAIVLASVATSHRHSGAIAAHKKVDAVSSSTGSGSNSLAISGPDSLPDARPLYPYSVIAGGVRSAGELGSAVRNDAVVARHYADFDVAKAHVISLDRDRLAYVSYRMGEQVFWTSHALLLHKGETLITDGTHEARTRCGNRIADTAQAPSPAQQPALDAFEEFAPAGELETSNLPIAGELTPPAPFSSGHPLALEHSDIAGRFTRSRPERASFRGWEASIPAEPDLRRIRVPLAFLSLLPLNRAHCCFSRPAWACGLLRRNFAGGFGTVPGTESQGRTPPIEAA